MLVLKYYANKDLELLTIALPLQTSQKTHLPFSHLCLFDTTQILTNLHQNAGFPSVLRVLQ